MLLAAPFLVVSVASFPSDRCHLDLLCTIDDFFISMTGIGSQDEGMNVGGIDDQGL